MVEQRPLTYVRAPNGDLYQVDSGGQALKAANGTSDFIECPLTRPATSSLGTPEPLGANIVPETDVPRPESAHILPESAGAQIVPQGMGNGIVPDGMGASIVPDGIGQQIEP